MDDKIQELKAAIAEINQGITLAQATVDNPFDAYLDKPAMIQAAKDKVTAAIAKLNAINL